MLSPAPTSSSLLLATQWGPAVSNFLPPTAGRWFSAVNCHLFQLCVLIIAFVLMVFFRKKKYIYQGFCSLAKLLPHAKQTLAMTRERGNDRSEAIGFKCRHGGWGAGDEHIATEREDVSATWGQ